MSAGESRPVEQEGETVRCECCDRRPRDGELFVVHPEDGFSLCPDCVRVLSKPAPVPQEETGTRGGELARLLMDDDAVGACATALLGIDTRNGSQGIARTGYRASALEALAAVAARLSSATKEPSDADRS